jgi:hypothetical protein
MEEGGVKKQGGEDENHVQAKERELRRNQPSQRLYVGLPGTKTVRKLISV